ncbi:MAG: phosphoribosylglycinamide formyltransferase [Nitrososphaeraceae archaeon]
MINLGILISGRGSNMESILSNIFNKSIKNVTPCVVISNKSDARGLKIAKDKFNIPTEIISQDTNQKGWNYDKNIVKILEKYDVLPTNGLICLAGYMKILSPEFVDQYKYRIMNIHPALLPSFPGLHSQRQALEYGVKVSGCTVHFVDSGVDSGPIILQESTMVYDDDTEDELAARILDLEHKLYSRAVKLFSEGQIKVDGRRVIINTN